MAQLVCIIYSFLILCQQLVICLFQRLTFQIFQQYRDYNNQLMQQIQQALSKRTLFRQQIRKRQVNEMFHKIRKNHKMRQQNSQFAPTQHIDENKKKQIAAFITKFSTQSLDNFYKRNYEEVMKDTAILKNYSENKELVQFLSTCLNDQLKKNIGKFFCFDNKDILKEAIQKVELNKLLQTNSQSKIQQQINHKANKVLVQNLLQISQKMHYNKFALQSSIAILKLLWITFQQKYHLPPRPQKHPNPTESDPQPQPQPSAQILNSLCLSLISLLNNPHHSLIKKHMRKLGFDLMLNQIIEWSVELPVSVHASLIQLVWLYNSMEEVERVDPTVNGISIINVESNYKSKYAMYSIFLIKRKYTQTYQFALLTLNQVFQQCPYFIDTITTDYYPQILDLTLHPYRKTNVAALQLLNTITFYSQSASDQLVDQNSVLDFVYRRLRLEKDMEAADQHTKASVEKCANVLCDLLMTRDGTLKGKMFGHHVWEMVYEAMDENSRLFGTVVVFKYFFAAFGRKQRYQILPNFLQAASYLPLQNQMIKQVKQIKQTLLNIFYHSMEYQPLEVHQQLLRLYEQNGLLKYIEKYQKQFEKI